MVYDFTQDGGLLVHLSEADLRAYGISASEFLDRHPIVARIIGDVLYLATSSTDIDFFGVLDIQFRPSSEGSLSFILRPENATAGNQTPSEDVTQPFEKEQEVESTKTSDVEKVFVYEFNDIEDTISLAQSARNMKNHGGSLYYYNNKYYLTFLSGVGAQRENAEPPILSLVMEYADKSMVTKAVLDQYGKLIIPRKALSVLRENFKG